MALYRRIDQLAAASSSPAGTDLLEGLRDPAGTPKSEKWTVDQLAQSAAFSTRYAAFGSGGGGGSTPTNLTYTAATRLLESSSGTDVTLPEVVASGASGLMTGADKAKLNGIEAGATADMSAAEIQAAYDTQVAVATQAEAEAGTSTTVRRWTAERIKQAIVALSTGATNLTYNAATRVLSSSTGTDVTLPEATTTEAGLLSAADKVKINGFTDPGTTYLRLDSFPVTIGVTLSGNPTTGVYTASTTTPIHTIRAPFGFTLSEVRATFGTAPAATSTLDIHGGNDVSVLGTKITVDAGERSSVTAAVPPTITDTAIANDEEIRFFLDVVDSTARNIMIWLIGTRVVVNTGSGGAPPDTAPTAPLNLLLTRGNAQITVDWDTPSSDGGQAINGYTVQYKLTSEPTTWTNHPYAGTTPGPTTITGLTNGSSYDVRVAATNPIGTGAFVSGSLTPYTVPGVPPNIVATPGDGQVVLAWDPPVSNGGESIDDYIVEQSLNGTTGWAAAAGSVTSASTGQTVTGLTNGTTYHFRVRAVNAAGEGANSGNVTATPAAAGSGLGIGTHTINPTVANSKSLRSSDEFSYSGARNGSGSNGISIIDATGLYVGQYFQFPGGVDDYSVFQTLLEFDTRLAPGRMFTSFFMGLNLVSNASNQDFLIEVYALDYGTDITSGDFVPGSGLTGTLVASGGSGSGLVINLGTGPAGLSSLNPNGPTRYLVVSSRQRLNNTPVGDEYVVVNRLTSYIEIDVQ